MVDRIEVLFGGESLFHGTDSLGGVVNVITKKPTAKLSGQANVKYGSYSSKSASFYISGGLGSKDENTFLVFANHEDDKGYQVIDDEIWRNMYGDLYGISRVSGYRRTNLGLKYSREFETARIANIDFGFMANEYNYNRANAAYRVYDFLVSERIAYLKWSHEISDNYSYFIKTFYNDFVQRYTQQNPNYTWIHEEETWYRDIGINLLNSYKFDKGTEILFGAELQSYVGNDIVMEIPTIPRQTLWAVFVDFRPYFSFFPEWKTSFGARYTDNKVGKSSTVWNASSKLPLFSDNLFLSFNVGTAFKLPSASNLYANPDLSADAVRGNPDLKPQSSKFLTASLGGIWSMGTFDVTSFYYDTVDKISAVRNTTTGRRVYQNLPGHTYDKGFTVSGTLTPLKGLTFLASYTMQKESAYGIEADYPTWAKTYGSFNITYNTEVRGIPAGISLYNTYTGKQYYSNMPTKQYGDYWNTDLSAYVKPRENFTVQFQITNLFKKEETYSMSRLIPQPGSPLNSLVDSDGYYYYDVSMPPFMITLSLTYDF
jgi:vitamin B12 transporter